MQINEAMHSPTDKITNAIMTVDYAHHEIHGGSSFLAFHSAGSKNDGDKINLYFKTPNTTTRLHAFLQWSASGAAYGRILEAPTVTANTGTNAQVVINRDRDSAKASTVVDNATSPAANKYGIDVTITNDGTKIFEEFSGAAKTANAAGRAESEIILKANTAYCFQVESDASTLVLFMLVSWYEHAPVSG